MKSTVTKYVCDICGKVQLDESPDSSFVSVSVRYFEGTTDHSTVRTNDPIHACSDTCTPAAVGRQLKTGMWRGLEFSTSPYEIVIRHEGRSSTYPGPSSWSSLK